MNKNNLNFWEKESNGMERVMKKNSLTNKAVEQVIG